MTEISIVIPCFNEAEGVPQLDQKLTPVVAQLRSRYDVEVVFVDDGSTDGTFDALCSTFDGREKVRVVRHQRNMNLGAAIRTGVRESTGEWIAYLDSDCTYEPSVLEAMLDQMSDGADLVTASPYHPKGRVDGVPGYRLTLSKGLTGIYRFILRKRIYTFTAMVRVFKRSAYPQMSSAAFDFTSVADMMLRALKNGLDVREVPAVLSVRKFGQSKMKTMRVIAAHLRLVGKLIVAPNSFQQ